MKHTGTSAVIQKEGQSRGLIRQSITAGSLKTTVRKRSVRIRLSLKAGEIVLELDENGQMLPFRGCGESAKRYLKLERGVPYIFKLKLSRNYRLLQKYFKLLNTVFENQDYWKSKDGFRAHTLLKIGHSTQYINPMEGKYIEVPKTISFDSCSEQEFREIYKKTLTYLMETYAMDDDLYNMLRLYE